MELQSPQPKLADFRTFLTRICKSTAELLRADAASVFLRDQDDVFVMRAGCGYTHNLVDQARYRLGEGITGWIAEGNSFRADTRDDVESHPRHLGKYDRGVKGRPLSLLGVPLFFKNRVYGLIKVEKRKRKGKNGGFDAEDLDTLKIFAQAISDSIHANDELLRVLGSLSVFVLIPFVDGYRNVYQLGIKQAVEEVGMRCERCDEIEFNDEILHRIRGCIRGADIIIAELSERNPNVFYETGYAHALEKPTIHLARNSVELPFNLQSFNHIPYDPHDLPDLQQRLKRRLLAARRQALA